MPWTAVSDCPTPTVSTSTVSKPKASQSRMVSRVLRVTPPSAPPLGEGRMKAFGSWTSCSMRVLSPRMEPRVMVLEGSTASTARRWPRRQRRVPSPSMKVLLPTPGTPVMPTRRLRPVPGNSSVSSRCAGSTSCSRLLSTRVMARASAERLPERMPSASSAGEGRLTAPDPPFTRRGAARAAGPGSWWPSRG